MVKVKFIESFFFVQFDLFSTAAQPLSSGRELKFLLKVEKTKGTCIHDQWNKEYTTIEGTQKQHFNAANIEFKWIYELFIVFVGIAHLNNKIVFCKQKNVFWISRYSLWQFEGMLFLFDLILSFVKF